MCTQALHHFAQSWPRGVGRDVGTGRLLDDRKAESPARQQLRGEDSSGPIADRASGEGDPQTLMLGLAPAVQQDCAPLDPAPNERQRPASAAAAAAQRGRQP